MQGTTTQDSPASIVEVTADRWPAAVSAVDAVRSAARAVDGQDPIDEAVALRLHRGHDAGSRLWLAEDAAGAATGFLLTQDGLVSLAVAPHVRGAGVATALVATATAAPPAGDREAWSHGNHPAAAALAASHGWRRVRDLWVMRRPDDPLPELPAHPGIVLRGFDGSDHDLAELIRVNAAAFADHPEQGAMTADDVRERRAQDWWDPDGLIVATDQQGHWLGFHWTKRHSATLGEVYVVGIAPQAQGRGLGGLLTNAGLRHLYGGGATEVLLYVESDNAPALAVYRRLGFTHAEADTHVMYAG